MKVLLVGDSVVKTTGFAKVLYHANQAFQRQGWEVGQVACLDQAPFCRSEPYVCLGVKPYFADSMDPLGSLALALAVDDFEPDVIFMVCDPGQANIWMQKPSIKEIPVVLYSPIDGQPVSPQIAEAFRMADRGITCTEWASTALMREWDIVTPWAWHGVDHNIFKPLSPSHVDAVRATMQWDGKFVVTYVARNNGRKAHDRLIKAARIMRDHGYGDDVLFYLHCRQFEGHALSGWDLGWMVEGAGVKEMFQFPHAERMKTGHDGVDQAWLASLIASSDLYVHPSRVEGFGLPILEAMACGRPILTSQGIGNIDEIVGDSPIARITPSDWDSWFNGAQLANLDPYEIAGAIEMIMQAPAHILEAAGQRAYNRSQIFTWKPFQDLAVSSIIEAVDENNRRAG